MPEHLRWTPLGIVAAVAAFVALTAYSPAVESLFWAPKAAVLPLLAGLGSLALVMLLRTDLRRPAGAALVFVVLSGCSAALSPNATVAVFGKYHLGTGWVFAVAVAGAWAIGAQLSHQDRNLVAKAIGVGVALNIVVAALMLVVDLSPFQLFPIGGRPAGLLGNPVYLASVITGATLAMLVHVETSRLALAAAPPLGLALQTTGSRAALLVAAVAVVTLMIARRHVRVVVFALLLGAGALGGSALVSLGGRTDASAGSVARLQAGHASGGFAPRLETWRSTPETIAQRPLLGTGPGTFALATSRNRTFAVAKAEGPERLFADAHNLVIEYAVTTGILGSSALLAWLFLAWRRASGPFAAFAAGILLLHLVQPQYVGTTPVAGLCLGAAAATDRTSWRSWGAPPRLAAIGAALLGLAMGALLLVGDASLRRAELDFTLADARRAERLLPPWPEPAEKLSKLISFQAIESGDDRRFDAALRWKEEAVDREPSEPRLWLELGEFELSRGHYARALDSFTSALVLNPQSVRAKIGRAQANLLLGRPELAVEALRGARPLATSRQRAVIHRLETASESQP